MATAALTASPTILDPGTAAAVWVKNNGTTRVTVQNGPQRTTVRAGRDANFVPTSGSVTAYVTTSDGGTGSITYEVVAVTDGPNLVYTNEIAPGTVIDGGTP